MRNEPPVYFLTSLYWVRKWINHETAFFLKALLMIVKKIVNTRGTFLEKVLKELRYLSGVYFSYINKDKTN